MIFLSLIVLVKCLLDVIVEIDLDTLDEYKSEYVNVLVLIHDTRSVYSNNILNEVARVVHVMEDYVVFARVDVNTNDDKSLRDLVLGLPALILYHNGSPIKYTGPQDADHVVNWLSRYANPPIAVVSGREEIKTYKSVVISFCGNLDKTDSDYDIFHRVSDMHRELGTFVAYECEGSASVEVIRHNGSSATLSDINSMDKLLKFIHRERNSYLLKTPTELDNQLLYADYTIIYFVSDMAHYQLHKTLLENIGRMYKESVLMVHLDIGRWKRQKQWLLDCNPCLVKVLKFGRYTLSGEGTMTETSIVRWIDRVLAQDLSIEIDSEPVGHSSVDLPVKVAVANNFAELVPDDIDVLLEIYAPWCGACRKLGPVLDDVARTLMSISLPTRVVAIDGTNNDIDESVYSYESFPTLYFKKAYQTPIRYVGSRNRIGILSYIQKHGSFKFDIPL